MVLSTASLTMRATMFDMTAPWQRWVWRNTCCRLGLHWWSSKREFCYACPKGLIDIQESK